MRHTDVVANRAHPGCTATERALRNVIFNHLHVRDEQRRVLHRALDRMTDPFLRDVTRQLLADEVLHGSFGFAYSKPGPFPRADAGGARRDLVLPALRLAVVERAFTGREHAELDLSADDHALGVVHPALARRPSRATMKDAVVPGLAARPRRRGRLERGTLG